MAGDEHEPLFVFRRRSADLVEDFSQDLAADIERANETTYFVIDSEGNRHQLQKAEYKLMGNSNVQHVLVDHHVNQSRWLLVDSWKQPGEEGYVLASYEGEKIQEATAEAKRRNATTHHPGLEQTIQRIHQHMEEAKRYQEGRGKGMMVFDSQPTIVRFSIATHLSECTLDRLEQDLRHLFPGSRLVAVYKDHRDWEGEFCGEIWNEGRLWFLDRYKACVKVILNPPAPRLDTDIYNVGLLRSPTQPLYLPVDDCKFERYQLGKIFHGPFHGLGFWWRVIARDTNDHSVLCMPAPPPVSLSDGVPRFLYCLPSRVHYKAGRIEYWCPCCWENSYSMEGVTVVPLADLIEPQTCTICGRDFCADDASAPEWGDYSSRYRWRRPRPQ